MIESIQTIQNTHFESSGWGLTNAMKGWMKQSPVVTHPKIWWGFPLCSVLFPIHSQPNSKKIKKNPARVNNQVKTIIERWTTNHISFLGLQKSSYHFSVQILDFSHFFVIQRQSLPSIWNKTFNLLFLSPLLSNLLL